jgi:hypothetical protein
MTSFTNRILLAAKLNPALYEEVEADRTAMGQAMGVVVLASLAAGIGSMSQVGIGIGGLLMGTISALVGWAAWAALIYLIGTRLLPEPQTKSDYGELLRTIGFASAPGLVRILGIIPGLMGIVFLVSGIWMLVATVIAARQALDYQSTARAVGVCLIGWLAQVLIMALIFSVTGVPTPEGVGG